MMDSSFNRKCQDVLHATSVKELSKQLVHFVQDRGFEHMAAMVIIDHSPTLTEFCTVTNAPDAFLRDFENLDSGRIDPVSQHCKRSTKPIVWDRNDYSTPEQQELWQRQAEFGYRSGYAFAMHFDRGLHFMFGVDSDRDRCEQLTNYKSALTDVLTFAAHAQAAAFELCLPTRPEPANAWELTKSEIEALRWTMDGKTSWEVGQSMSMSEWHVSLLLQRAMRKLDCSSNYEMILRAIKLRLIECPDA